MDTKKDLLFVGAKESPLVIRDKPAICRVERSSVLDRLQSFLPQMRQANEALEVDLKASEPTKYNIEAVDETKPYIQMNLGFIESTI
eukprot:TRINITY_DN2927_c0_g1_i3.p1 TRINITY_DN2927_c0_g1~~TRINITY_DN2927_c0_g1_i3.p1  ORF type:complete len:101 (+),score=14.40 TRINITY_DN2927_c0_g1_i3:45-305(+)